MNPTSALLAFPSGTHLSKLAARTIAALSLAAVLVACQVAVPNEQSQETIESIVVTVDPSSNGSPDLEGQTVSGTIIVSIPAEGWMKEVRFFLNGQRRLTLTQAPFDYVIDTTTLADGPHVVGIEAVMPNNRIRVSRLVEFVVRNEGAAPRLPSDPSDPTDPPAIEDPDAPPPVYDPGSRDSSLRGNPGFSRSQLTSDERVHYDRLWQELGDPANLREIQRMADSDDLFTYARPLHGHIQSVLTVFRFTGDLALLDHVDTITQRMRAKLDYGWRDTLDGTDGQWSQYRMWVWRYSSGDSFVGKDNRIDDLKTHALIAMVAYALDLNRDLTSPAGTNYGANADFWKTYLDHFETKLRDRHKKASGFPITTHSDAHSWWSWTKWHYFMWKLTGDGAYLSEANRMADVIWNSEIKDVAVFDNKPYSAYVWTSNISATSDKRQYLMSTAYANNVYGDVVTFHLEGFHNWADERRVANFARTVTEFVLDTNNVVKNGITADVGGDVTRAEIPPSGGVRRTATAFVQYQTHLLAAWDSTGEIARVAADIQSYYPSLDTTRLAAGLFVSSRVQPTVTASATAAATAVASR